MRRVVKYVGYLLSFAVSAYAYLVVVSGLPNPSDWDDFGQAAYTIFILFASLVLSQILLDPTD